MNPTRRCLALAAAAFTVAAALGGPSLGTSMATAQTSDADSGYQPCDPSNTSTVDLLLVMDQSGSLREVDPGGEIRREALKEIRNLLEDGWTVYPDGSAHGLRAALVGFDTSVHRHAPDFEPVAPDADPHPSDEEIEAALQSRSGAPAFTDYGEALRAAPDLFGSSQSDCQVMVWFTDGLHDPVSGRTTAEVEGARELRDEVCTIRPEFERAGIQTYAVLLGNEFVDPEQPEMADLSRAMIHAVTGHSDSPVVADLPRAVRCDGINVQTGEILTAGDVKDLINTLRVAVLKAGPDIWQWPCDAGRDDSETHGVPLPSSTYVDWMEALAFGGEIESYALLDIADDIADPDWQPLKAGQRRLRLESEELRGLSAGWVLKMRVRPDDGRTPESVTLRCYSSAVDQPLRMHASVLGTEGQELDADRTYTMSVYMWPYECPVDEGKFVLEPQFPTKPLPNHGCAQGQYAEFTYSCGNPEAITPVTQVTGELTPRFSENLLRGGLTLDVEVEADFVCLPPLPTTTTTTTTTTAPPSPLPELDCEEEARLDGEWIDDEFSGRVMFECIVAPPEGGTSGSGNVRVTPSDGLDIGIEGAEGTDSRQIDSSDLPTDIVMVIKLAPQGPWDPEGEVRITLEWQPPDEPPRLADSKTIRVDPESVDPLDPYDGWPTLQCPDVGETQIEGEVPQQPLRVTTQCAAVGPGMGSLQLTLEWSVAPAASTVDLLESIDWRFQALSESDEGARFVALTEGEQLDPISFATARPLENERHEGGGTLSMRAEWLLPWEEQRLIGEIDMPIDVDLLPRSIWWLAALLVVAAALITYTLLYAMMDRSARLPSPKQFFATRVEFRAQLDGAGNLTSAELDNISMDADKLVGVKGDPSRLRVEDLSIRAEHPRWRHFKLILDGGWGRPSLKNGQYIFGASPAHSRRGISSAPIQFTHLAVIALRTGAGAPSDTVSGSAYLLVPKSAHDGQTVQFVNTAPNDLLRKMTATHRAEVADTPDDHSGESADPGSSQPPAPPPRVPLAPPSRDRTQHNSSPPRRPRQGRDTPGEGEPPPRRT